MIRSWQQKLFEKGTFQELPYTASETEPHWNASRKSDPRPQSRSGQECSRELLFQSQVASRTHSNLPWREASQKGLQMTLEVWVG